MRSISFVSNPERVSVSKQNSVHNANTFWLDKWKISLLRCKHALVAIRVSETYCKILWLKMQKRRTSYAQLQTDIAGNVHTHLYDKPFCSNENTLFFIFSPGLASSRSSVYSDRIPVLNEKFADLRSDVSQRHNRWYHVSMKRNATQSLHELRKWNEQLQLLEQK